MCLYICSTLYKCCTLLWFGLCNQIITSAAVAQKLQDSVCSSYFGCHYFYCSFPVSSKRFGHFTLISDTRKTFSLRELLADQHVWY